MYDKIKNKRIKKILFFLKLYLISCKIFLFKLHSKKNEAKPIKKNWINELVFVALNNELRNKIR
tara:strand:- start:84 stop:275 length:192 start_codon:yes stop_codon:yes gene_type:complete